MNFLRWKGGGGSECNHLWSHPFFEQCAFDNFHVLWSVPDCGELRPAQKEKDSLVGNRIVCSGECSFFHSGKHMDKSLFDAALSLCGRVELWHSQNVSYSGFYLVRSRISDGCCGGNRVSVFLDDGDSVFEFSGSGIYSAGDSEPYAGIYGNSACYHGHREKGGKACYGQAGGIVHFSARVFCF